MKTKDILFESGNFWVFKGKDAYYVMKNGATHSESESAYPLTPNGLSIAIARTKYLGRRK